MAGRWLPPFTGITESQRWSRIAGCAAVVLVTGVLMVELWPRSPGGSIIDFELAGDRRSLTFLQDWTLDEQRRAAQVILLDLPFLVAYALGGSLLLDGVARRASSWHEGWSRVLAHLAWLPIAAAGFDLVEDVALVLVTADRTQGWADLARTMAQAKFFLIDLYLVVLVLAVGSAVVARVRRPPATALTG
jgi:hypothetical protein